MKRHPLIVSGIAVILSAVAIAFWVHHDLASLREPIQVARSNSATALKPSMAKSPATAPSAESLNRVAADASDSKASTVQNRPRPTAQRPQPSQVGSGGQGGAAQPADEPQSPVQIARTALSSVGADPDADAAWFAVINDPSIEPKARKDLIEDLNEDGFPDPKNLTPDDAPLIINRMALIEELAPAALDDVNFAAFQEAYKDLVKMLARLSRQ